MAESEKEDVEILIRAGAPSRTLDDARYRAMVHAYLTFVPETRHSLGSLQGHATVIANDSAQSQLQAHALHTMHEERESAESWIPEEESGTSVSQGYDAPASMSFMDSPEMSFRSVFHNIDSPSFRGQTMRKEISAHASIFGSQTVVQQWEDSRSAATDSYIGSSPILPRSLSPTKALDEYSKRITNGNGSSASHSSIGIGRSDLRRSSRISRTSKDVSLKRDDSNSSSSTDLALSPSPNRTSPSKPRKPLRRLDNSASPPKVSMQDKAVTRDVDIIQTTKKNMSSPQKPEKSAAAPLHTDGLPDPSLRRSHEIITPSRVIRTQMKRKSPRLQGVQVHPSLSSEDNPIAPSDKRRKSNTGLVPPAANVRSTSLPVPLQSPAAAKAAPVDDAPVSSSLPEVLVSTSSTNVATSSASGTPSLWDNTYEINSKSPAASHRLLKSEELITPQLRRIIAKMSRDNPFGPVSQVRGLRPLERGCWSIDCSTWNDGLRSRAWVMLGNFVGEGMAGWGIRCVRTKDRDNIRAFCWGVVTEHVWFLLFLASEGKIKHSDACWIGGDGNPIITMR